MGLIPTSRSPCRKSRSCTTAFTARAASIGPGTPGPTSRSAGLQCGWVDPGFLPMSRSGSRSDSRFHTFADAERAAGTPAPGRERPGTPRRKLPAGSHYNAEFPVGCHPAPTTGNTQRKLPTGSRIHKTDLFPVGVVPSRAFSQSSVFPVGHLPGPVATLVLLKERYIINRKNCGTNVYLFIYLFFAPRTH